MALIRGFCPCLPKDITDQLDALVAGNPAGANDDGGGGALSMDAIGADEIVAAFRQALSEGVKAAVAAASAPGGFASSAEIKISLPAKLGPVDVPSLRSKLKVVGQEKLLDDLELKMNEAAEKAAGEAQAIFVEAIQGLSVARARELVKASTGSQACTTFFRNTVTVPLTGRMKPIVQRAMDSVGCVRVYEDMRGKYNAIPFVTKLDFNLVDFVVEKAIAGLFVLVGAKEEAIRANPQAAATAVVKKVFSRLMEL